MELEDEVRQSTIKRTLKPPAPGKHANLIAVCTISVKRQHEGDKTFVGK